MDFWQDDFSGAPSHSFSGPEEWGDIGSGVGRLGSDMGGCGGTTPSCGTNDYHSLAGAQPAPPGSNLEFLNNLNVELTRLQVEVEQVTSSVETSSSDAPFGPHTDFMNELNAQMQEAHSRYLEARQILDEAARRGPQETPQQSDAAQTGMLQADIYYREVANDIAEAERKIALREEVSRLRVEIEREINELDDALD